MLEAKDTVMSAEKLIDILVKASKNKKRTKTYELLVAEAQAEISFKAGYEQRKKEVEMTTVSLANMLREQRQAGMEEARDDWNRALDIAIRESYKAGIREVVE